MKNTIENARELVANFKSGTMKTAELNQELIKKVREYTTSPQVYKEFLNFSAKFYKYSSNNRMLIHMQNPFASYLGSFMHFKKLGYNIRKGQHGYMILVPAPVKVFENDAGEIKRLRDATPDEKFRLSKGELTMIVKKYFKPGTIFDISQTDIPEAELPEFLGRMAPKRDSRKRYIDLRSVVEEHGIDVMETDFQSVTLDGRYNMKDDSIRLNDQMGSQNKYVTLLHEFTHALLHKNNPQASDDEVEFEAESVTYMVLQQTGADISDYSFNYIPQHFKNLDDEQIMKSLRRINSAAGYITEKLLAKEPEALPVFPESVPDPMQTGQYIFQDVMSDVMEE
jgi:hypothetical protein